MADDTGATSQPPWQAGAYAGTCAGVGLPSQAIASNRKPSQTTARKPLCHNGLRDATEAGI